MVQTIFVYTLMAMLTTLLCYIGYKKEKPIYVLLALIGYSIVMGLRYNVGVDYKGYLFMFQSFQAGTDSYTINFLTQKFETGYIWLLEAIVNMGFDFPVFFGVLAFVQVLFLFLAVKNKPEIWFYLCFTFMSTLSFLTYANVIRQWVAFGFIASSLLYIKDRKWVYHYCLILLAFMFHKSMLIFVMLYPIYWARSSYFNNRGLQITLFLFSLLLMRVGLVQSSISYVEGLVSYLGFEHYLSRTEYINDDSTSIGFGFIINQLIRFVIIMNSDRTRFVYKESIFPIVYDLAFIGMILGNICAFSLIFTRMVMYFSGFIIIAGAFTLAQLYQKKSIMFYALTGLYIVVFVGSVLKNSVGDQPYQTIYDAGVSISRIK